MTFYDFAVARANTPESLVSISEMRAVLQCVRAIENHVRLTDPEWTFREYTDEFISGALIKLALLPLFEASQLSLAADQERAIRGLVDEDTYVVSYASI